MESDLKIHRGLLSSACSVQYNLRTALDGENRISVFRACTALIKELVADKTTIINLKGRDQLNTIHSDIQLPFDNELFSYHAVDFLETEDGNSFSRPFDYFILSPFCSFEDGNILHSLRYVISAERQPELSLTSPLTDLNLQIRSFRMGLDFYGQNPFASWFFRTPVVTRTFLLEAGGSNLSLRLNTEGIRKGQDLLPAPLQTFVAELGNILLFNFTKDLKIKTVSIY